MRLRAGVAACAALAGPAGASTYDGGNPGYFLNLGLGARALGMGYAQVASGGDIGAVVWNPAGLARLMRGEAVAGGASLVQGASHVYLGVAWPTVRFGTVAFSYAQISSGDVESRDRFNEVAKVGYSSAHRGILIGYGLDLGLASIGATAIVVQQSMPNANQTGVTASVGGLIDVGNVAAPLRGLSLGLRIGDALPASFGSAKVPLSLRGGLEYRLFRDSLALAADADMTTTRNLRYGGGLEYTYRIGRTAVLARAGWMGSPTGGVGLRVGPLRADYAVAMLPAPLGVSHRASVALPFGPDIAIPKITIRAPVFNAAGVAIVPTNKVDLDLAVESRDPLDFVKLAGKDMKVTGKVFRYKGPVGLKEGKNPLTVDAQNRAGRRVSVPYEIFADTQPPIVDVLEPKHRSSTDKDELMLKAIVTDASDIMAVAVNDLPVIISPSTRVEISQPVQLRWSKNIIKIAVTDRLGHTRPKEIEVARPGAPPPPASGEAMNLALNEAAAKQAMEKGREYLKAGKADAAVVELRYAVRLMPTLGEAQKLLDQAEKAFASAPTPAPVTGSGLSGEASAAAGMTEEVKRAIESHFYLGKQLLDAGKYKKAELEFQLVVDLNKKFRDAMELLERCRAQLNDSISKKLAEANSARAKGQLSREITALREVLTHDDQHKLAQDLLRDARTKVPEAKKDLHRRALDFYAQERLEEAVKLWKEALELDPDDEQIKRSYDKAYQRLLSIKGGALGK